jgi:hypothetical protein
MRCEEIMRSEQRIFSTCSTFVTIRELAEMRRQIAELKAEAAQADNEDDSAARWAGPEQHLFMICVLL